MIGVASFSLQSRRLVGRGLAHQPARPPASRISPTRPSPRMAPPATPRTLCELLAERLDHDFLLAEQLVDDERDRPAVVVDRRRRCPPWSRAARPAMSNSSPRWSIGISRSRTCTMHGWPWTRVHLVGRRPQRLADGEGRHHEALVADREQHAVDDGQRQRQPDRERRALAARRSGSRCGRAAPRCCGARRPCRRRGRRSR